MTGDFMLLAFGVAAILSTAAMHYRPARRRGH